MGQCTGFRIGRSGWYAKGAAAGRRGAGAAARFVQGYDAVAMGLDATLLIAGVKAQIAAGRGQ